MHIVNRCFALRLSEVPWTRILHATGDVDGANRISNVIVSRSHCQPDPSTRKVIERLLRFKLADRNKYPQRRHTSSTCRYSTATRSSKVQIVTLCWGGSVTLRRSKITKKTFSPSIKVKLDQNPCEPCQELLQDFRHYRSTRFNIPSFAACEPRFRLLTQVTVFFLVVSRKLDFKIKNWVKPFFWSIL